MYWIKYWVALRFSSVLVDIDVSTGIIKNNIYIYIIKYINSDNPKIVPISIENKIASGIKLAPLPLTPTITC